MALATLQQIKNKVRLITRRGSEDLLTDAQLTQYINTFLIYNFPQNLRLYNLRKIFTFYTQPGVDVYAANSDDPTSPLYRFNQLVTNVHPPVFFAGIQGSYTQWRDEFYATWPQTNYINYTGLFGNGTAGPFIGQVARNLITDNNPFDNTFSYRRSGVLQRSVMISTLDQNGQSMTLVDFPITNNQGILFPPQPVNAPDPVLNTTATMVGTTDGTGAASGTIGTGGLIGQYFSIGGQIFTVVNLTGTMATTGSGIGTFDVATGSFTFSASAASTAIYFYQYPNYGTINYQTGIFTAIFPAPTAAIGLQSPVIATTIPYIAGKPIAMLYYEQEFVIRPVPDKAYKITLEADLVPTELIANTDTPQIEQWWQYISYGTARLIFQDNMDLESVNLIEAEFKDQEVLVNASTIQNRINSGTETIFSQGGFRGAMPFGWPRIPYN